MVPGGLGVQTLLARATTSIGAALVRDTLELVLGSTAGVVLRANVGGEAGVRPVVLEAALGQVGTLRLGLAVLSGVSILAGSIDSVRRGLATVVLTLAAAASRGLTDTKFLLGGGRATDVARLGNMRAGVVALAA